MADVAGEEAPSDAAGSASVFTKWWFWAALGVVALVAVAGVAGASHSTGDRTTTPAAVGSTGTGNAVVPTPSTTLAHPGSSTTAPAPSEAGAGPASAPPGLGYGPGPETTYTVQAQPPAGSCRYRYQGSDPLPDPRCTPGARNPQVTARTIGSTICTSGYTSSIRPPERVTAPEKEGSARAYGYAGSFSTAEYDHLVPLELGGDPNDPANLWVEPNDNPDATSTSNTKDALENRLNGLVCTGQVTLDAAQEAIASNWVTAYETYVARHGPSSPPPATNSPPAAAPGVAGTSPTGCHPTASSGNCYRAGEYCPSADHGEPGVAANGEAITCEDDHGTWRWERS